MVVIVDWPSFWLLFGIARAVVPIVYTLLRRVPSPR